MAKITNGAKRALSFELDSGASVTLQPGQSYSGKADPVIHSAKWRAGMEARGVVFADAPANAAQKPASKRSAKPASKAVKPADAASAAPDAAENGASGGDAA